MFRCIRVYDNYSQLVRYTCKLLYSKQLVLKFIRYTIIDFCFKNKKFILFSMIIHITGSTINNHVVYIILYIYLSTHYIYYIYLIIWRFEFRIKCRIDINNDIILPLFGQSGGSYDSAKCEYSTYTITYLPI